MMHEQPMQETAVVIRPANREDAPALHPLVEELGYFAASIADRLCRVLDTTGHHVLVAETRKGQTVGWIHVFGTVRVESDPFAEIGGLVVARSFRGCGAGRRLVAAAERWARDNGYDTLRIRSRTERADAHRFFELQGYSVCKTQRVFERSLAEAPR
jgi:GNAT superfamily N-acetyltransferase